MSRLFSDAKTVRDRKKCGGEFGLKDRVRKLEFGIWKRGRRKMEEGRSKLGITVGVK